MALDQDWDLLDPFAYGELTGEVFPQTQNTWIDQKLAEGVGGRQELNHHIMNLYAFPLRVYFLSTSDRWLGEPDDVVQGFFASRLDRNVYFDDWRKSGLRLRRWLMNGFCFYLKEMRRERRKDKRSEALAHDPEEVEDLDSQIDRAFAVAIVQRAMVDTQELCEANGFSDHWKIFFEHYYEDKEYKDIAPDFEIDTVRAATMARTVSGKFRKALRDLLVRDGATEAEVNQELAALLEASGGA